MAVSGRVKTLPIAQLSTRIRAIRAIRMIWMIWMIWMIGMLIVIAGCGGGDDGAAAGGKTAQGPGGGHSGGPGGRPPQAAIPVAVQSAVIGDIASYYEATATLEAEKQAEVLARVSGMVEALLAEEGDRLESGAALLRIDNDEYRLRVEQAMATTANQRARFERMQAMMDEQLATEEEFQAARSDLANAEADEGLARLNLSYTTVRAPFSGSVTGRMVDVGANVSSGTALFLMADFNPLLARVHVPSKEFNQLQRDQQVELVLDSDGTRLSGRITLISPIIDPSSGTIKVTVEVPEYPAGTRPGDFASVRIVTELRHGVTLVPRGAVLTEKGESVVYVVAEAEAEGRGEVSGENPPGGTPPGAPKSAKGPEGAQGPEGPKGAEVGGSIAERRMVELGFSDDRHTQILAGVQPGDRIVVKGQRSLKHGAPLKILEDDIADATAGANADATDSAAGAAGGAGRGAGH